MKPIEPGNCFLALFVDGGNFSIFRVFETTMFRTAFFCGSKPSEAMVEDAKEL